MTRPPVTCVGVVVPVHDEADLLDGCLAALIDAADASPLPVDVVAVLDSCSDGSEQICLARGVRHVTTSVRNVGMARSIGTASLLCGWETPAALWIAGTDADTVVPVDWITRQVALADAGADLVLGVVDVADHELAEREAALFARLYGEGLTHSHVHGANLGVRGDRYLAAGGYPPLANHEDHALVAALLQQPGLEVVRTSALRVRTSGRLVGRCAEGFANHLAGLAVG